MLTVAVDTGPLHGPLTGVGRVVTNLCEQYRLRSDSIDVLPYLVSRRAHVQPGTVRLPYPALLAMRVWARADHPRVDKHLARADILHGMNYVVPPARRPRVVSVYDTWALHNPTRCSAVVNTAMQVLRRNIASGAVVHTSSHATADELRNMFPKASIHVIHLGAPDIRLPRGLLDRSRSELIALVGTEAPYVLCVGTVERRKNLPRLITAFARTRAARSGVHLVIVGGSGDDSDAVATTIDALDSAIAALIRVVGRVSDETLDVLYGHAALVAYPSLDEGFGFPVLEAMSQGIPVVAANTGSIPEVAGDAAVLVDPLDVDDITEQIDSLLSDRARQLELVGRGFERCAQFSWEKTASRLIELYASLVEMTNDEGGR